MRARSIDDKSPAGEDDGQDVLFDRLRAPVLSGDSARAVFDQLEDGFCVVEVLFDDHGDEALDYRFLDHNDAFVRHTGLHGALGRTARELVPGLDAFWFETYGRVAKTGVTARFEEAANAMGRVFEVQAVRVGAPEQHQVAIFFRDITSLRRAQAEIDRSVRGLAESEERLRLVTDDLPVLVSLIDTDLRYRFVNAAYERWFGLRKEEILGRQMVEVLGERAFGMITHHLKQTLAGIDVTYEVQMPYRTGGTRWIQAIYRPRRSPEGRVEGIVALVVDVSERKAFEAFRARADARNERLLRVTSAIAGAVSSHEVHTAIVDRVLNAIGKARAALWLAEDDELRLAHSLGYGPGALDVATTIPLASGGDLPVGASLIRREALWFASASELAARYPAATPHLQGGPPCRYAFLPLATPTRALGVLAVSIEAAHEAREDERELLLLVARYASQALERLRLLSRERAARQEADGAAARLQLLSGVSHEISAADLDLAARVRAIPGAIGRALGCWSSLFLIDHEGALSLRAAFHPSPEAQAELERLVSSADSAWTRDAMNGETVITEGTEVELGSARGAPALEALVRALSPGTTIKAPLRARGRVLGVLTASRVHPEEAFSEADRALFEELSERVAVAIENSRLYEDAQRARARAELLHRFGQLVAASERVETIFEAAFDALASISFDRAALLILDEERVMRVRASRGLTEVAELERPLLWLDGADSVTPATPLPAAFERDLFLPLATRGVLSGALLIGATGAAVRSGPDLETARAIANYLSSVIARFGALAELQETLRYNELFAGILAHDLRNPINAVLMAAQLLLVRREGHAGDPSDTRPVGKILASGERMAKMVDQLLDFTRARSGGGIAIQPVPTNLANLCAQALDELTLVNPDWRFERKVEGDPNGFWDPDRLLQIISNLASNAGQHGGLRGPITVRIDGTAGGHVTLCVHNDGAVAPEILSSLFDPFHSARRVRERSQGLGLGLFIVREIARAHGGAVTVSSSDEEGTAFRVRLPRSSDPTRT